MAATGKPTTLRGEATSMNESCEISLFALPVTVHYRSRVS
jgi:hypothetical protein